MATSITYNSFNLNDSNHITSDIDDASAPDRELSIHNLLRSGGAVITDSNYYTKLIPVTGKLVGSSMSNLETRIDTLQAALSVKDKNLDIGYAGSTRRYVCTPSRVEISRPVRGANWASFQIDFIATEFGKDTSTTTLVNATTTTSASATSSLSIGGSAPDQKLRLSVTVTAATGLTNKTIGIENDTTGELIEITRDWTVGDVLVVDCSEMTVQVDGTDVDFEGPFPVWAPGTHDLILTNDFTTRTLTRTFDYVKRYL